ncbi:MAG: terminase large subunit domain-containing protein [Litorivicinaceae bacterium]
MKKRSSRLVNQDSKEVLERKVELLKLIREREKFNQLEEYDPYPFQERFIETTSTASQSVLCAGNRVGKTRVGAFLVAAALTGRYPDNWYQGRRFNEPITAWCGGVSTETVRDIVQAELLGTPGDSQALGTGMIPKDCIIETQRKPGVPNAVAMALIKHVSGGTSYVYFKAFNMGNEVWMGRSCDLIWLDEEPPREIYTQAVTRTLDRKGTVFMTYTPESGMSETTAQFFNDLRPGQALTHGSWDDASERVQTIVKGKPGHLTESVMSQILAAYPPHEREMRKYGRPTIGSGLVFPVPEEKLLVDPFPIPEEYQRIGGIDFGWDHPTAVVWIAYDADEDIVYVYDTYRQSKVTPAVHATAINTRPRWISYAWPHDGNRRDSMGNPGLADQYRGHGVNLLPEHFTNPPAMGEKKGGNSIEVGIMEMLQRMESGRFKVFSTQTDWLEELRMFHRKDGKINPIRDDLMAASRYAVMSLRFASPEGESMWKGELKYPALGIV